MHLCGPSMPQLTRVDGCFGWMIHIMKKDNLTDCIHVKAASQDQRNEWLRVLHRRLETSKTTPNDMQGTNERGRSQIHRADHALSYPARDYGSQDRPNIDQNHQKPTVDKIQSNRQTITQRASTFLVHQTRHKGARCVTCHA